jgi:hypothetical protein
MHDMGGERASTVRQIRGEEFAPFAGLPSPSPIRTVSISARNAGANASATESICSFRIEKAGIASSLKKISRPPCPADSHFNPKGKVRQIAERGGAAMNLDTLHALDHAIEIGRGGVWLELTEEQYRKLFVTR